MIRKVNIPDSLVTDILSIPKGEVRFILDHFCKVRPKEISLQNLMFWAGKFRDQLVDKNQTLLFKSSKKLSDLELRFIYGCISCGLGNLNDAYGYFFEVKDRGLDYKTENIAVSKTNAETGFHTDSTSKDYAPRIVGLLCLQSADHGGESLMVNAEGLWKHLNKEQPELIPALVEPTIRDVITRKNGDKPLKIEDNRIPIFEETNDGLKFRYMRYWIERAHQKLNQEIPNKLLEAMDAIDTYFSDRKNTYEFKLERGEMLFINNLKTAHNRRAYRDSDVQRVLLRTWID